MKGDQRYTPTDCFDNFPFPVSIAHLNELGDKYHEVRRQIMQTRQEGLTKTYNRVNDSREGAKDIAEFRALQVQMDQAVAAAYGWSDLALGHDFYETKQGVRFTISESARRIILDRLLVLNDQRHAEEEAHEIALAISAPVKRRRRKNVVEKSTLDLL